MQLDKAVVGVGNGLKEVGNDEEHSAFLQLSNISFLIQYLGGYAQLDEAVVGDGNGLEEVSNCVRKNADVLQQPCNISFLIPGRRRLLFCNQAI